MTVPIEPILVAADHGRPWVERAPVRTAIADFLIRVAATGLEPDLTLDGNLLTLRAANGDFTYELTGWNDLLDCHNAHRVEEDTDAQ